MAWKDTLQDAKYKGVALNVMATDDSAERAQVRHEYPYRDGAEVEDLGRRARQIRLQCVFFGKDYEAELRTLFEALAKSGPGELIHPVFGSITASLLAYHVQHQAENRDHCLVVLDFVEAEPDAPFFGTGASAAAKAQNGASRLAGALDSAQNLHAAATGNWSNRVVGALSYVARGALVSDARMVLQRAAEAARRAKKKLADSRLEGWTLTAQVRGHRTGGQTGAPWKPGQRVHVVSEPLGLDSVYFLMKRAFVGGKDRGRVTELTLKEDGVWLPELAAAAKAGSASGGAGGGKKGKGAGEVVDLWATRTG